MSLTTIRVSEADFNPGEEIEARRDPSKRAAWRFVGVVRNRNDGNDVTHLTLEHYPAMTEVLAGIVERARARWDAPARRSSTAWARWPWASTSCSSSSRARTAARPSRPANSSLMGLCSRPRPPSGRRRGRPRASAGSTRARATKRPGVAGVRPHDDQGTGTGSWLAILAVGTGAGVGAVCRWMLSYFLNPLAGWMPWGTLASNAAGGLLIGAALAWTSANPELPPAVRLFVITGFLGRSDDLLDLFGWSLLAHHVGRLHQGRRAHGLAFAAEPDGHLGGLDGRPLALSTGRQPERSRPRRSCTRRGRFISALRKSL